MPDAHPLRQTLDDGLSALGLDLDAAARETLLAYLQELEKWNRAYNLTAVRDPARMVPWHLLDSLALAPYLAKSQRLLDVGSGAGLPGIPLAIAVPDCEVTLLDAKGKKTRFLTHVKAMLRLANLTVVQARIQDYRPDEAFDTVTCRAFAGLPEIVRLTEHLVSDTGRILAMKGQAPEAELADLPPGWRADVHGLSVPGVDGQRHLIELRRTGTAGT